MSEWSFIKPSARLAAAHSLGDAAALYPDLPPAQPVTADLDARDAQLARAIHRLAIGRWLTIEHLLDRFLRVPMQSLEPGLRGLLLSAGAQLLFMDRLPAHAVVDESVKLARQLIRPGAAGLVNAVLRRLAEQVGPFVPKPWAPAASCLPLENGYVNLKSSLLPDPRDWLAHWSVATSHPPVLVNGWTATYGLRRAGDLCLHGVRTPPIIVALEANTPVFSASETRPTPTGDSPAAGRTQGVRLEHHVQPAFAVWTGLHDELRAFLAEDPARRVQDPASAAAVMAAKDLQPKLVVDLCAGRGTKTRQLAVTFPQARLVAHDPDAQRMEDLRPLTSVFPNLEVPPRSPLEMLAPGSVDLLLLDVPCSNTGVLGRRPEARYRFTSERLQSLADLQRRIVEQAVGLLGHGGHLLYSTCSIEPAENQQQAQWIVGHYGAQVVCESLVLPEGSGSTYHAGGYYALLRWR